MGVAVELHAVEHGHHTDVFHVPVLHDSVEDDLPVGIDILQLVPCHVFQESRHGENGPRTEPTAHVIAAHVVEHRVVGYLEDVVLQLFERAHPRHFLVGLGVAEDKVAESHVFFHETA